MNLRKLAIGLALLFSTASGCGSMANSQPSGLGPQMSESQPLGPGPTARDDFAGATHKTLTGAGQPLLTNAR